MTLIAWNLGAGDASGVGLSLSGTVAAEAVLTGSAEVDAGGSKALALQIDDVARVAVLIVSCTRYDGSVSIKGAGQNDTAMALEGPVMAFGPAAGRIAASLETMTIAAAAAPATPATVSFLIGTRLT